MGNQQFKCPSETVYGAVPMTCVMSCPSAYELRMVDGAQRCVHRVDPSATVQLRAQPAVGRDKDDNSSFTIESLKTKDPDAYSRYSAEQTRFNRELKDTNARVDRQAEIDEAERDVVAAAGTAAQETANQRYLELTNTPDVVQAMHRSKIESDVNEFINEYQFLNAQMNQQQQTLDLVNSVKDNLLTVKDDMEYSVGTFSKQISDIRNQININRKSHQLANDYGRWLSVGLNVFIVLALIFLLFTVGRQATKSFTTSSTPAAVRPAASEDTNAFFSAFSRWAASATGNEKK